MMTRSQKHCTLKALGLRVAGKRGHKRAVVAAARKLAIVMHRMWLDGTEFHFSERSGAANDKQQESRRRHSPSRNRRSGERRRARSD